MNIIYIYALLWRQDMRVIMYKGNIQGLKLYLKYLKRTHGCVVERIERKDDGFVLFVMYR